MAPPSPPADLIVAEGLGKRFDIYRSDRGRLWEFLGDRQHHVEFWALRDVGFRVRRGRSFGVIGSNGAGKSTLLRLLSGVSRPTEGQLTVSASTHGLLDLGLGFHDEFTGRENIRLNCALMGIPDQQVDELIPKIVAFAEIEDFIDYPVRTYSSGMQLRLGFSITAHVEHELLLIDEVLTVGDQYFQRKCMQRIEGFLAEGRTLVLVSHDLHSVRSLCDEVLWLHGGRVVAQGPTQDVVDAYVDTARGGTGRRTRLFAGAGTPQEPPPADEPSADETWFCTSDDEGLRETLRRALHRPGAAALWADREERPDYEATHGKNPVITGSGEVRILDVKTLDGAGRERSDFVTGDALTVAVSFRTFEPVERPVLGVALFRSDELYVFGPNTRFDRVEAMEGTYDGVYTYFLHYPTLPLLGGTYRISVALFDKLHVKPHVWHNQLYELRVSCPREDHGVIEIPHHWGLIRHARGPGEELPEP